MRRLSFLETVLLVPLLAGVLAADGEPTSELLLPGGMLFSVGHRAYRQLHLPAGWTVKAGAYSPDSKTLALVLVGANVPPAAKLPPHTVFGPLNKLVRTWKSSTHLVLLSREGGLPVHTWTVPGARPVVEWTLSWTGAAAVRITASPSGASADTSSTAYDFAVGQETPRTQSLGLRPAPASTASGHCPVILADTVMNSKTIHFTREDAACSTPPEPNDVYSLIRENEKPHPDTILWQYRVAVSTGACDEPYACYTGNSVHFLSSGEQHFLAWDADLYRLSETDGEFHATLVTQWLPDYSHPWGISDHETMLNPLDVESKEAFQPATQGIVVPHYDHPQLYAQNFCPTRSFNAAVTIGSYKKSVMVPAGYQVGPMPIGSFDGKDEEPVASTATEKSKPDDPSRVYTPLLVSLTWTSFHHISEPVSCSSPYTLTPNTNGIVVSISENANHTLHCEIGFQDGR